MIIKGLLRFTMVLGGWFVLSLVATAIPGFADRVDVLFPPSDLIMRLPSDVRIVDAGRNRITLTGQSRDFTLSLYRAGALLVIPSNVKGCLDLKRSGV